MDRKRLSPQVIGLTWVLVLLVACGTPQPTSVPTPVPTPTSTSVPPTATPTPPVSIPGIDEPVVVENTKITVLEAHTLDSLLSGDRAVYPDNPSDTFFEVVVDIEGGGDAFDWVASNIRLVYEGGEYKMVRYGVELGEDGKFGRPFWASHFSPGKPGAKYKVVFGRLLR